MSVQSQQMFECCCWGLYYCGIVINDTAANVVVPVTVADAGGDAAVAVAVLVGVVHAAAAECDVCGHVCPL